MHVDLHLLVAVAGGQGGHWRVATLVTQSWLLRTARQSGKAGTVGAGRVGWGQGGEAGSQGWVAGLAGGWPGGMAD